uniref:IGF-like family receptor 1 n=1 Tax=Cyclopterus lumpus TaxID=8103 RepID=A0A8C2WNB2_CYCLU
SVHIYNRCSDLKTYWNRSALKCALCTVTPGYGITPNCGFDDDGGRHEPPHTECIANATFNDGSDAYCRPCAACARGFTISSACSTTSNIKSLITQLEPLNFPPLGCDILTAPLQAVLDNLDVLEELVILLDPENQGVKNTKHLASHCSFPATWITYTYSMKDSKSPLKTLLEGVTSRHPDWTVGRLAKMLKHIERNDAIAVLTKLELNVMQV